MVDSNRDIEERSMQVSYQLTRKDLTEALTAHRNRSTHFLFRPVSYLLLLALWVWLYVLLAHFDSARFGRVLPFLGLGIVWAVVLWVLPWLSTRQQFSRTPSFSAPKIMSCSPLGIHWDWDSGSTDLAWKNFVRLRETKGLLLLYTSVNFFHVVPKRAFSPEELADFRRLLAPRI